MAVQPSKGIHWFITAFVVFHTSVFIIISILQFKRTNQLQEQYDAENTRMLELEGLCQDSKHNIEVIADELQDALENVKPDLELRLLSKRQPLSMESLFEELLNAQMSILEQHCVNNSHICVRGTKGERGDPGDKGAPGINGSKGDKGIPGLQGPQGSHGDVGETGLKGFSGSKGDPGVTGPPGPNGSKGDIGLPGNHGDKGDKGLQGQHGDKGIKGEVGLPGVIGAQGQRGLKGQKGNQGRQGPQGDKGQQGSIGPSGNITDSNCVCIANSSILHHLVSLLTSQPPAFQTTHVLPSSSQMTSSTLPPLPFSRSISSSVGNRVVLHCDVGTLGSVTSHPTWSKEGSRLFDRIVISGADLEIPEVYQMDGGVYKCVTTKPNGLMVTETFTLNVSRGSYYDCDFEVGFCGWTQSKDDQLDWTRHAFQTSSATTGPSDDHTLGAYQGGHYIYLETTSGLTGDKADLVSSFLSKNHTYCLRFWYHMYGTTINELSVLSKGQNVNKVWTMNGNQGNQWHHGNITLQPTIDNYQLVFRAIRGYGHTGDIALDDVILLSGPCNVMRNPDRYTEAEPFYLEDNNCSQLCGNDNSLNILLTPSRSIAALTILAVNCVR